MDFRVLGPLEAWADGVAMPLGTRKQQIVLAVLLLNANCLVSVDELVDELWPDHPPPSAVANVRGYVGKLRRSFAFSQDQDNRVVRKGTGYLLRAESDELDMLAFLSGGKTGRMAASQGDLKTAVELMEAARACWRGAAASGMPRGRVLTPRCTALEEERLAVTDELAEFHLMLDQPGRAVALLREQVRLDPLRERSHGLLMRSLCKIGNIAGVLAAYADARTVLVEQLGIEPGRELRELHRAALCRRDDLENLTLRTAGSAGQTRITRHPRELPADVAYFVGRADEVARLRAAIEPLSRSRQHRAALVVVHGSGGSGKSTLAIHVGQALSDQFPDGQLYVDLLGSTPGLRPLSTIEVLHRLLGSFGYRDSEIPHDLAGAISEFRTISADRRLLLVLDNASDTDRLGSLVPASGTSAVIVTSRRPLLALDADLRIKLSGLATPEGCALLLGLAKNSNIDDGAALRIVKLCENLPLALRIAAGRLAGLSSTSVLDFAERLADRRHRLDELELEGLAVRSSIMVGYEALAYSQVHVSRLAAQIFRLLGSLNVPDFQAEVVAAMLDGSHDIGATRSALNLLISTGLLEPQPDDRYRLHDLVRLVAVERAADEDEAVLSAEALHRAIAFYAGALREADRLLKPGRMSSVIDPPKPIATMAGIFSTPDHARAWVEAELPSLVSVMEQATSLGDKSRRLALYVGDALWGFLFSRQQWNTARRLSRVILDTAERNKDLAMAAWAHVAVGRSSADFSDWEAATRHFERALSIGRELGNPQGVALALNSLGLIGLFRNDNKAALRHLTDCLELAKRHDMRGAQGVALSNLGVVYSMLSRWKDALGAAQHGLAVRREIGSPLGIVGALRTLASVQCSQGNFSEAVRCTSEAIALSRETGDQMGEHFNLLTRCEANLRHGWYGDAVTDAEQALVLSRSRGDRYTEALALRQMCQVLGRMGNRAEAIKVCAEADEVYRTVRTRRDPLLELLLVRPNDLSLLC